jgi:lipopolysaccharide biosynthesis protein/trans-aconitate methyltransferase
MEDNGLKPDGEWSLPQLGGAVDLEYDQRYFRALALVDAKDVLDIASREGRGSEILSRRAKSVVGIDISTEAVARASAHHVRENLRFLHGSATEILLPDNCVDVIVCFETVQHLVEHDPMMTELKRVLRADGLLIISSPSQLTDTDRANHKNLFHLLERAGLRAFILEPPHGPLQPKKVEGLVAEVEAKAIDGFEIETAWLPSTFYKAMRDGTQLLEGKWWRPKNVFRRLSNKIRKWRGKSPKTWPSRRKAERYLGASGNDGQAAAGKLAVPIDGYSPTIPRVKYSEVSDEFVAYEPAAPMETVPKAIAFYLPQFHPFPENDAWWGKGFTEWTNVGKAKPMFQGHHQPHFPLHLGYYDLRVPEVMEEQARLARQYGISGFAYYFYWFAGKVLMDLPLQNMLRNPRVDMPFCMIWANENWTRNWDGRAQDVLIAQKHSLADSCAMLDYLRPFMQDPRYIKVNGKPLFIVYRADIIPDMKETILAWRRKAVELGFPDIYVVCAQSFKNRDPRKYGFDAAMEFPPHMVKSGKVTDRMNLLDSTFDGSIYCYDQVVENAVMRQDSDFKVFPAAMLSWDNTARQKTKARIFANFSARRYSQWLASNAERVTRDARLSADEKLIFINAWNEWAEGTHLEPDQKHGYGYLAATRAVMKNYVTEAAEFLQLQKSNLARSKIAVIVHLHYEDTWLELCEAINRLAPSKPDVYVTVTSLRLAKLVAADMPDAVIALIDNRGRDIRPFLVMLERTRLLGYNIVAKVHGKMSVYRDDGAKLRQTALEALLSQTAMDRILNEPKMGLLVPQASLIQHSDKNMADNGPETERLARELGLDAWRGHFPVGSMFWFRPEALARLLQMNVDSFDVERGLVDGTRAHAVERLFCSVCEASGFEVGMP